MSSTNSDLDCQICYSSSCDQQGLKFICLTDCQHSFCSECFEETYRSLIEDENALHKIKCPQFGCQNIPSEQELQNIIPLDVFQKYTRFKLKKQVITDPNLIYCSKNSCENILFVSKAVKNKIECEVCQQKTCKLCKQESHSGKCLGLEEWMKNGAILNLNKCPQCLSIV